jgi:ketosteroid isomerase-like protein
MKISFSSAVAAAFALSLSSAAFAQTPSVKDLADRWTAAYNEKGADAVANLYSERAELYIHKDQRYVGRGEIKSYWAEDLKIKNPLTVLTVTDSVVDNDMMLVHGNYLVVNRTSGVPMGQGRFAHIWVRNNGSQWQLDRDLWMQP